ncbi:uncharacterized protein PRCAT00005794001 [Priceomyces carsonii]|uniref:uncharacterized protein n=1 Tax=Priceomyces carsonii TaxID=28549 RepID=UPI002ED9C1D2|nr:unnamed protein product [Priceomyces carsonii]
MRFIRDSFFGRLLYHTSDHKKFFKYKEEREDYVIPEKYLSGDFMQEYEGVNTEESSVTLAGEIEKASYRSPNIIVDYDGPDDPDNPYNWPIYKKIFFISGIGFLTISVYMGSAIYTPGIDILMEDLGISRVKATLPLSMFVIGYGIGPMVFSPMSENAIFGRTSIYIVTVFIFFIFQIPQSFGSATHSLTSLCVLRLLSGIFASPALGTGGASAGDVITASYMPMGIIAWSLAAVCGPTLGPLVGSALINGTNGLWIWTLRFMMIISCASFIFFGFTLPESLSKTILRRKAQRLRALTGNPNIKSEGELENEHMSISEVVVDTLWRPFEISFFEPVILLIDLYIALIYSILYLWFEAFPIVFIEVYRFTIVDLGVSYVSVTIGMLLGSSIYIGYIYYAYTKKLLIGKHEDVSPEVFLPPTIAGSVIMPIGIFIFGWTASAGLHWIGPMIGAALFGMGGFVVIQALFNYMAMSFPRYIASVFGGNALFRSIMAGCFPLFGAPLFNNLKINKYPVGWGSTILACICVGMIAIPVTFYKFGPRIRAKSRYSGI